MQGTVAQTFALQKEKVREQLTLLYQLDDTLVSEIETRAEVETVSSRPTRIPLELLAGGTFTTNTPDGGDLGLGSAPITDYMTLVPTYFFQCNQWTKQAEISTNGKEKAVQDYVKLNMKRAMQNFRTYREAIFTQGAGDNQLDTASATAAIGANSVVVHNANQFQDQQPVDVWTQTGGTFVGTFTVQSVDAANKTLWLTGPLGFQVTSGYGLYVKGSAGVANAGLYGLFQAAFSANTGTCFGLSRASYPGKLIMPYVNGSNLPITPSTARKLTAQMQIALGATKAFELDLQINMGPDQMAAWENNGIMVSQVIQNQLKGDESQDMLKKHTPRTFMGFPIVNKGMGNIHAKQGRIDGVCVKSWGRVENQPIDFLEYGGQTLFPQYGASGGLSASTFFYLWVGENFFNDNPRAGFFADNLTVPSGY